MKVNRQIETDGTETQPIETPERQVMRACGFTVQTGIKAGPGEEDDEMGGEDPN